MKTKTIIALLIVLALSVALCITAYASISAADSLGRANDVDGYGPEDRLGIHDGDESLEGDTMYGNTKRFTFALTTGEKVPLTFRESINVPGVHRDVFIDSQNNEYSVDVHGDVVGYMRENSYYKDIPAPYNREDEYFTNVISEDKAVKIAEMHCKSFYGKAFDDFKFRNVEKEDIHYSVEYFIAYGEDDFLVGATCRINVLFDGRVTMSSMGNYKEIKDLDPALLDGITMEKVEEIAEANARATYMDDYVDSEVRNVWILNENGKYSLKIDTVITFRFHEGGINENFSNARYYYYGLS